MSDCKNCVLRQPTDNSAPCFDPENPLHYECAVDSDFWPDRAEICPDRTENAFGPYYLTVEIPDLDRTRKELESLKEKVRRVIALIVSDPQFDVDHRTWKEIDSLVTDLEMPPCGCPKELESLRVKVQQANNYLSGGGGGARSVQHAAELWGRVCAAEDKPKVCPHCNHSPCLGQIESDDCVTA